MKDTIILQFETMSWALHQNLEGLSHEESLGTPEKGGNCPNWVVGHLAVAYDNLLEGLGAETVLSPDQKTPYERGSAPLDRAHARPFAELMTDFDACHGRVVAKLASLSDDELAAPAPYSPRNDPDETVGSLAALLAFHQAYHAGQAGLLRRVVGKPGAIA